MLPRRAKGRGTAPPLTSKGWGRRMSRRGSGQARPVPPSPKLSAALLTRLVWTVQLESPHPAPRFPLPSQAPVHSPGAGKRPRIPALSLPTGKASALKPESGWRWALQCGLTHRRHL